MKQNFSLLYVKDAVDKPDRSFVPLSLASCPVPSSGGVRRHVYPHQISPVQLSHLSSTSCILCCPFSSLFPFFTLFLLSPLTLCFLVFSLSILIFVLFSHIRPFVFSAFSFPCCHLSVSSSPSVPHPLLCPCLPVCLL